MLTDHQFEVARVISAVAGPSGFALAGGGAMIVHGIVDRATTDLDFFATQAEAVTAVARQAEVALQESGFEVVRRVDSATFVRLDVRRGGEACEVDLAQDARRWPTVDEPGIGATVAAEELAADKTLALLGRAAARDFIDVRALGRRFGSDRLCELAVDKDPGFRRLYLAEALSKFDRLDRAEFGLDAQAHEDLRLWAWRWRVLLIEQSRHLEQERGLSKEQDRAGPEIGF
ncbi:MAG: nucleotidyl transferase AbiEii/AbiGii toxin family protein [Acidimicrobiales bacterium]